jgi:CheY-like chemotaxis protein
MALTGPVLVIEDDTTDADVIATAIVELGATNKVLRFTSGRQALDYLMTTTEEPMLIMCDIRMPGMNGLTLLREIHNTESLRRKAIPFIFFTALVSPQIINEAYETGVQGFFRKADSYTKVKDQILSILLYWNRCLHPNSEVL